MTIFQALLVFLGGGIGSVSRFFLSQLIPFSTFPIATLIVNVAGSGLIGFFYAYGEKGGYSLFLMRFLIPGVLGGFTTFSAFSFEVVQLLSNDKLMTAFFYASLSIFVSILAAYAGWRLSDFSAL